MTKSTSINYLVYSLILIITINLPAQELLDIREKSASDALYKISLRSKNAISIGVGSILLNGDYDAPDYENFLELQLKRFISPKFAISGNLRKFDIENFDFEDNGFLSGNLNVEWYLFPKKKLTPYLFVGLGVLLSNDFRKIIKYKEVLD